MAACNERPNQLGDMYSFAEYERDHVLKTFRHFPQLRTSVSNIDIYQKNIGRDFKTRHNPNLKPMQRSLKLKYTHKLEELSKSSIEDFVSMDDFRKILLIERNKQKKMYGELTGGSQILTISKKNSSIFKSTSSISKMSTIEGDDHTASTRYSIIDLEAANQKLAKVAVSYDALSNFNILKGFQGAKMDILQFDGQLKRCINVNLTKGELYAMFKSMDIDDSNTIEPVEFIRYFFDLGNKTRQEARIEVLQKYENSIKLQKQKKIDEENRLEQWKKDQIANFTNEDVDSAMKKLSDIALRWDNSNFIDAISFSGFQAHLSPFEFKQQIEKSFGIRLTKGESGALLEKFSTREGEYCIDGELFLKHFTRIQKIARMKDYNERAKLAERKKKINSLAYLDNSQSNFLGR